MKVKCALCGKILKRPESYVRQHKLQFCNSKCMHEYRKGIRQNNHPRTKNLSKVDFDKFQACLIRLVTRDEQVFLGLFISQTDDQILMESRREYLTIKKNNILAMQIEERDVILNTKDIEVLERENANTGK